ncbi:MAG: hypothetical protein R2778_02370 [Saprospiraceae bacterium]
MNPNNQLQGPGNGKKPANIEEKEASKENIQSNNCNKRGIIKAL